MFWTEPVLRTIYLGQVNLVLMALILWDLCQPDTRASRWWKGLGVGVAAGIKLVPLIFIPYLLLTRRFRQAAVAARGSRPRWRSASRAPGRLGPVVAARAVLQRRADRIRRLGGQPVAAGPAHPAARQRGRRGPAWLVVAVITTAAGLACAAVLDRAGHQFAGLLATALTGLLVSPISWDHHWVWIVPGVALAASYAVRAMRGARSWPAGRVVLGILGPAAAMLALYGAWPGRLWGEPTDLGPFSLGVIWQPPNTDPVVYYRHGDQPRYPEYHWHGIQMITGNAYLLGGLAALALLIAAAVRCYGATPSTTAGPAAGQAPGGQSPVLREVG